LFNFKEKPTVKEFEDFFVENVEVIVIDLGSAKMIDSDESESGLNQTFIQTDFSAPEMKTKRYGFSSDIWSIGTTALFLLTGKCKHFEEKIEEIEISGKFECSLELVDFINCLLQKDPKKRLRHRNILNHPFLKNKAEDFQIKDFNRKININQQSNKFDIKESDQPIWNDIEIVGDAKKNVNEMFIEKPLEEISDFENNPYEIYDVKDEEKVPEVDKQQEKEKKINEIKLEVVPEEKQEPAIKNDVEANKGKEVKNVDEPRIEPDHIVRQFSLGNDMIIIKEDFLDEIRARSLFKYGEFAGAKIVEEVYK